MGTITIQLGNFSGDQRNLTKTLRNGINVNCEIYESCSIYNPLFVLDYKPKYIGFNYVYVDLWHRYYFITGQDLQAGKKVILRCHCDVLNSFGSQLLDTQFRVKRSETRYDPYIPDNGYVYQDQFDVIGLNPHLNQDYLFSDQTEGSTVYLIGINGNPNSHYSDIMGFLEVEQEPLDWATTYRSYYINRGSTSKPEMQTIGVAIDTNLIPQSVAENFSLVNGEYGPIYARA